MLLTALLATAAAVAACGSDSTPTPEPTSPPAATPTPEAVEAGGVSSDIVNFTHQDLVVSVGTSVTWGEPGFRVTHLDSDGWFRASLE